MKERQSRKWYVIKHMIRNLYWSNTDGWVDRETATIFTEEERLSSYLPMEGIWVIYE